MKYLSDQINGSAWLVFNKKNELAAKVHALYTRAGVVRVDVYNFDGEVQKGSAGGYGYDKLTAALSGLEIGGVKLTDHCGQDAKTERILKQYHAELDKYGAEVHDRDVILAKYRKRAEKIGAKFANWNVEKGRYGSLFLAPGLDKLKSFGYKVYQAV